MSSRLSSFHLLSSFAILLVFSAQVQANAPSNHFNPTKTAESLYVDDVLAVGETEAKLVNAFISISDIVVGTSSSIAFLKKNKVSVFHGDWIKTAMTIQRSNSGFDDCQGEDYSNISIQQN